MDAFDPKPQAGQIKSIQRGVTLTSGQNGSATISPVNPSKTELRHLGVADGSGTGVGQSRINLANATTIFIFTYSTSGTSVSWELTERY